MTSTDIGPVVLFGAAGFIGRHLLARLDAEGVEVVTPTTASGGRIDIAGELETVRQAVRGARVVVNAAGRAHVHASDPSVFWPANALGAWRVAQAVAAEPGVQRLVHVSSVAVGAGGVPPAVANYQPFTAYGASKAAGEIAVATTMEQASADLVITRPAGIGGLDSPGSWGLIRRLVEAGRRVPIPQTGVRHDVVEIEEVTDHLWAAVNGSLEAGVHALAGSVPVTLEEYARRVAAEASKPARIIRVSEPLLTTAGRLGSLANRAVRPAERVEQLADTLTRQRPLVARPAEPSDG